MKVQQGREGRPLDKVIVADDEPEMRRLLSFDLRRNGVEVIEVSDGAALVDCVQRMAESQEGLPDAIISDVRMPRMDGLSAIARIRRIAPDLPVIVISGFASGDVRQAARQLGARMLDKPFDLDDLFTLLAESRRAGSRRMETS